MVKIEDVRLTALFFWGMNLGAEKETGCPCYVSMVSEEKKAYKVINLDDFKESGWLPLGKEDNDQSSPRQQMRKASEEETFSYIARQKGILLRIKKERQKALDEATDNVQHYETMTEKFIRFRRLLERKPVPPEGV